MKKAILLLVFLFTSAVSQVLSQPMNRPGMNTPGVQQLIIQYGDELQLTDDQKDQLLALQIEHRKQFQDYRGPANRNSRGKFRDNRSGNRQGSMRGQGFNNPEWRGRNWEARLEMRNEVLELLTEDQQQLLHEKMIERAERAHEFRTFRHEYIINEAGIEGEKADQVLALLNAQSANRLEMAKQRITNPEEMNRDLWADHFQQMKETDVELRTILTVDEYESLRQHIGFGKRFQGNFGRGYRMRGR